MAALGAVTWYKAAAYRLPHAAPQPLPGLCAAPDGDDNAVVVQRARWRLEHARQPKVCNLDYAR